LTQSLKVDIDNTRIVSIVDDDPDIILLFHDALKTIRGITIFTFTNPTIALEHFTANKHLYALVITDLRMPVMDGIQLISKIKDMNKSVRTVLMTAFDLDDKLFKGYNKKEIINGFAQKPISLKNFVQEVTEQLHSYEMQKKFPSD
jgi:response regulator RpfG family c-di-GMP phosphodiesterase